MRKQFLSVAHGGMTGGLLTRKRIAASIQSRAYWPTWSSDLRAFLQQCQPDTQYCDEVVFKKPKRPRPNTPLAAHRAVSHELTRTTPRRLFPAHEGLPPDGTDAAITTHGCFGILHDDADGAKRRKRNVREKTEFLEVEDQLNCYFSPTSFPDSFLIGPGRLRRHLESAPAARVSGDLQ